MSRYKFRGGGRKKVTPNLSKHRTITQRSPEKIRLLSTNPRSFPVRSLIGSLDLHILGNSRGYFRLGIKVFWIKYSRQEILRFILDDGKKFPLRKTINSSTFGIYRFTMECRNIGRVPVLLFYWKREFPYERRRRILLPYLKEVVEASPRISKKFYPRCLMKYFPDQDSIPFSLKNPTFLLDLEETGEQRELPCFMFILCRNSEDEPQK